MKTSTTVIIKNAVLTLALLITGTITAMAQDTIVETEAVATEEVTKTLARAPFESGIFMDEQTAVMPPAQTLEFVLQHRFGTIQNHWSDLYGIWGASNIRIGLNYTITKDLQVGFGTTKNSRLQDFQIKYILARQYKGGFPFTVALYGNMAINASNKDIFGTGYRWVDRFSYTGEVMIARRLTSAISLQLGVAWVHYNIVDSAEMTPNHVNGMINDNLNISGIGRYKISPQTSICLSYSQPVLTYLNTHPWPNVGLGVEISTSTHAFHIFIAAADGIVPQEIYMYNKHNPYNGALLLGFNMTRLWSF